MSLPIEHNPARFFSNAPVCLKQCKFRNVDVCGKDSVSLSLHADSGYCPENILPVVGPKPRGWESWATEPGKPSPAVPEITPDIWGPPLWRELHAWAASANSSAAAAWLEAFATRVPCGPCREHWRAIVAADPPDWSALSAWAVRVHDAVNVAIGKPKWDGH